MVKAPTAEMKEYRKMIDDLDIEIARMMGQRFDIVRQVARHKKAHGIPAVLSDRVDQVIENVRRLGRENNVDPALMETLYQAIITHACELEDTVIKN